MRPALCLALALTACPAPVSTPGDPPVDGMTGLFGVPTGWIDPGYDDSSWAPAASCTNKAMSPSPATTAATTTAHPAGR